MTVITAIIAFILILLEKFDNYITIQTIAGKLKIHVTPRGIIYFVVAAIGLILAALKESSKEKPIYALMSICDNANITLGNPYLQPSSKPDSFSLNIVLCNKGNDTAFNLRDTAFIVYKNDSNFFTENPPSTSGFNKDARFLPTESGVIQYPITKAQAYTSQTYFFYLKVSFDDNEHKNQLMHEIFILSPIIENRALGIANRRDYEIWQRFLTRIHKW